MSREVIVAIEWKTPRELEKRVDEILGWSTGVALFPVRHHSPTCARQLERWLRKTKPTAILIEGPSAYNDRIEVLSDPEHVTPFSLVATARRDGEVVGRAYYPFCDYSPELVALRVGKSLGAELRFIDLSFGERGGRHEPIDDEHANAPEETLGSAEDGPLARSSFTEALIAESGCRDFDEVWETLFELRGWDLSPHDWAVKVTAYALLSRQGYSAKELEADETLEREELMAWHLTDAQKKHAKIAVVTGAFHTVALRESKPKAKSHKDAEVFLAPYTFPRLDALLGYASGMSGPEFYQLVWDHRDKLTPFAHAAERTLVEASRLARRDGEILGTADAISATAFATELASFRGRPHVGRVEVIEAARSCFVKGDTGLVGARVQSALAEVMRGTRVGKLGPSAGQSPLIQDFNQRLQKLRLPLEHGRPQAQELEIWKSDLALSRSRFFHQTNYLEIPFAQKQRGPDLSTGEDLHLTIEHWALQYVPEVETRLSELSHLGSSVEDVAAALLVKAVKEAEGKSAELAKSLLGGLVMGLHGHAERLVPRLAASMFSDDDPISLLSAAQLLRTVLKGRERLSASMVRGLPQLAQQAYVQGALRLEKLASVSPDRIDQVLEALSGLLDVALTDAKLSPSRELLLDHAKAARDVARAKSPSIFGALDGFLLQLGVGNLEALAKHLESLSRGRTKHDGLGAYLEGVLAVSRQALLGDSALLTALLEHIEKSEWDDFLASLPSLRRALTRLTPAETNAVAERAAKELGVSKEDATAMLAAPPEVVSRLSTWEESYVDAERAWGGNP
ncbi:MAG: hypothetical protein HY791_23930 [Deltaproteobacteria bacterium]|nr:hypothetical protein [Deltaproteobacteria bacterium]